MFKVNYYMLIFHLLCFVLDLVAFLRMGFKSNVILVDWGGFAQPDLGRIANMAVGWPRAVKNVPRLGKRVSNFLMFLITERVLKDPTRVHLIGFSLGAEVKPNGAR